MGVLVSILVIIGVVTLVGAAAYAAHLAEKKRTEEFKQIAGELGFEFHPLGEAAFLESLKSFQLFSQGHSRKQWNLLRGKAQDLEVAIFDYRYVTGSGKHKHAWNQTVICFHFAGQLLPSFALRPERFADKIGAWLGHQDIDFETHQDFSSKYLLRSSDESAIRALFNSKVLDFYDEKPGLTTEGGGNTLLFYRQAVRVRPPALRSFLEEGFGVLALFRSVE